jgi:hypothetical protein
MGSLPGSQAWGGGIRNRLSSPLVVLEVVSEDGVMNVCISCRKIKGCIL